MEQKVVVAGEKLESVSLTREMIDEVFANSKDQFEVLISFYRLAIKDWDKVEKMNDHPLVSDRTNHYIMVKAIEFDHEHHPDVLAGGFWMNRGFSIDACVDDWTVQPCSYTVKYPYWSTDREQRCPKCGSPLEFKVDLVDEGEGTQHEHVIEERCASVDLCDWVKEY